MIEHIPIPEDEEAQQKADYQEVSQWRDEDGNLLDEEGRNQAVQALKAARERLRRELLKGDYDETN